MTIVLLAGAGGRPDAAASITERVYTASGLAGSERIAGTTGAAVPQQGRRRRGTFGGYIEDAVVRSQVRIRFDAGFDINAPDRAEFFYAKCGCYVFDPPPAFDPDAPGPGPGVPTELNFQQLYIQGDYLLGSGLSLFAELPYRGIQPQGFVPFGPPYDPFPDQSGFADIRVGAKMALVADEDSDVTLQVRAAFPTGDPRKGASTDTTSIEPALLFHQDAGERFGFEGQIGMWFPFGGSDAVPDTDTEKFSGNVLFYGIGPSFDLVATDTVRLTPIAELVGWRVMGGNQTLCPTAVTCFFDADDNIVNLKLGARFTHDRNSVYAGYGFALTDAVWYDRVWRFEYRYAF